MSASLIKLAPIVYKTTYSEAYRHTTDPECTSSVLTCPVVYVHIRTVHIKLKVKVNHACSMG